MRWIPVYLNTLKLNGRDLRHSQRCSSGLHQNSSGMWHCVSPHVSKQHGQKVDLEDEKKHGSLGKTSHTAHPTTQRCKSNVFGKPCLHVSKQKGLFSWRQRHRFLFCSASFLRRIFCYDVSKVTFDIRPGTGHEDPDGEQRESSTISLTSTLDRGRWLTPRPGSFTPSPERAPVLTVWGWVGPRAGLVGCGKLAPPVSDPRTVPPVASRYTDWAMKLRHCLLPCLIN